MNTVIRSARSLTRGALVLALAGLLSVLSGGLLIMTGGPAQSDLAGRNLDTSISLEDECVPAEAETETTDWITASPGEGWYEVDSRTVTDEPGYSDSSGWVTDRPPGEGWELVDTRTVNGDLDEEGHWQHYSWRGGPLEGAPTVVPPHPDWQRNVAGDPHGVGVEGPYDRSNEHSGKADWFYLEWVEATYEQVTEHLYERDVAPLTHEEYLFAFDHPEVECPDDPTDPTDPTSPTDPTDPVAPTDPTVLGDEATGPTDAAEVEVLGDEATEPTDASEVEVLGAQATRPNRTVPRAVDAGTGGWTTVEVLGTGLAGGGVLLLLVATGALMGARRPGVS